MIRFILCLALCFLAACTHPQPPRCAPGLGTPMAIFTLYLGKAIPNHDDLTDKEWRAFQDQIVTTNLPNGYTVLDGNGGWMNPITRKTIKEGTKILIVALPETPDSLAAVERIRTAYQLKFHQQLVGMTVEQACGLF